MRKLIAGAAALLPIGVSAGPVPGAARTVRCRPTIRSGTP